MNHIPEYENIETEFPELQKILWDALQSDFLEIKGGNQEGEKFLNAWEEIPGPPKCPLCSLPPKPPKKGPPRF